MSKIGIQGGKVLFHGSKVQFGCNCCCQDPEFRNLFPPNNAFVWLTSEFNAAYFVCEVQTRYADTVELYVSTDEGSSYTLTAATGRGINPIDFTQDPVDDGNWYWTRLISLSDVDGDAGDRQLYLADTSVWWKLRITNDCGAPEVWTTPRVYRYLLRSGPPESVDCNSCGPQLKRNYIVTFSGLTGAAATAVGNLTPILLPSSLSTPATNQNCTWTTSVIGPTHRGVVSYAWLGSTSEWLISIVLVGNPGGCPGGTSCFGQWTASGSACAPITTFTSVDLSASGSTCCSGTTWGGVSATVA